MFHYLKYRISSRAVFIYLHVALGVSSLQITEKIHKKVQYFELISSMSFSYYCYEVFKVSECVTAVLLHNTVVFMKLKCQPILMKKLHSFCSEHTHFIAVPPVGHHGAQAFDTHHFSHVLIGWIIWHHVIVWQLVLFNNTCRSLSKIRNKKKKSIYISTLGFL